MMALVTPAKRRKCRPPAAEEEETTAMDAAAAGAVWTPRPLNDLKISSIYNRSATEAPAELFRKDLISAMKLPDSEPLSPDEYWVITDQWKQEWERGVQVPVNPDSLPEPTVSVNQCPNIRPHQEFKLPKSKYIRITKDEFFTSEEHYLSNTPAKAEKACSYDLDDCDIAWLQIVNGERACMGSGDGLGMCCGEKRIISLGQLLNGINMGQLGKSPGVTPLEEKQNNLDGIGMKSKLWLKIDPDGCGFTDGNFYESKECAEAGIYSKAFSFYKLLGQYQSHFDGELEVINLALKQLFGRLTCHSHEQVKIVFVYGQVGGNGRDAARMHRATYPDRQHHMFLHIWCTHSLRPPCMFVCLKGPMLQMLCALGGAVCQGLHPITEDQLERVIEELEIRCWEKVQTIVKTEEGLGIEYDENVICDVCRSVSYFTTLCQHLWLLSEWDEGDDAGEMSLGSSTDNYPAFSRIGLRKNPGKSLNQSQSCHGMKEKFHNLEWESNLRLPVLRSGALPLSYQVRLTPKAWNYPFIRHRTS
ncbi:hypothetical protein ANN_00347 [Periplaneta americana]|uniref:Uncharacterized protein n=1 Tax=Periplaneta americana TaxID=6978 RepID=A0ABQ8TTE6_PERAM|nr:hypothetical protein ANN_00347 [Periplaneta americana]